MPSPPIFPATESTSRCRPPRALRRPAVHPFASPRPNRSPDETWLQLGAPILPRLRYRLSRSRSMPTSTVRSVRSSSQSISSSAKARRLRDPPVGPDRIGPVEVGQHEDVEQLSAGTGAEGVQALPEAPFEFVGSHGLRLFRPTVAACLYICPTITGAQCDVMYPSRAASHRRPERHLLR